jgi:hypothetical protein
LLSVPDLSISCLGFNYYYVSIVVHQAAHFSARRPKTSACALFVWLISHQLAVLFSQNKPATSNQPAVLFSHNKSAPAISHQPNEQAAGHC